MNITLSIDEMHCASCVLAIEKQLKKIKEVSEVNVNLIAEKVYITCDDNISTDTLINAVSKAGFSAFLDLEI